MPELSDARILIVDDQAANVLLLERLLERQGYLHVKSTTDPSQVVAHFQEEPPDLLLLDLRMPQLDGFAVMELLKPWTTGESYIPVLVLTSDASRETKLRALEAGARDFMSKPFDAIEVSLRIGNLLKTRQLQQRLESLNEALEDKVRLRTHELEASRLEAFQRLGLAAEYRDDDTGAHTRRVAVGSGMLGAELGLDDTIVEVLEMVAGLHDLGKIGIPDAILLKPGKLTDEEYAVARSHATIGAEILRGSSSPLFKVGSEIALTHHERWDGSGYPAGLSGEQIPLSGRIVALVDAFDAMTHVRTYKPAMPLDDAVAAIERAAGSYFDPAVVAAFRRLDPELLQSPHLASPRMSLTESAWRTLRAFTPFIADGSPADSEAALAAVFEDTPIATLVADDDRRYVSGNAAACDMLGLDHDELRTKRIDDFTLPDVREQLDEMWEAFMQAGTHTAEIELLLPDGTTLAVTYRGVAHLLPGRHLSLLEPARGGG